MLLFGIYSWPLRGTGQLRTPTEGTVRCALLPRLLTSSGDYQPPGRCTLRRAYPPPEGWLVLVIPRSSQPYQATTVAVQPKADTRWVGRGTPVNDILLYIYLERYCVNSGAGSR
jgi:hypothetical protein